MTNSGSLGADFKRDSNPPQNDFNIFSSKSFIYIIFSYIITNFRFFNVSALIKECEGCFFLYKEVIEGRKDVITKDVSKDTRFFSLSIAATEISPDYIITRTSKYLQKQTIIFSRLYLLEVMRYYKEKYKIK